MPYTTDQITAQERVVAILKEDINWKKDVSYNFLGLEDTKPTFNGTRTEFWAAWSAANPNATSAFPVWTTTDGVKSWAHGDDAVAETADVMWDFQKFDQEYATGYEVDTSGAWATYITDKETLLATEESTLATMEADPA